MNKRLLAIGVMFGFLFVFASCQSTTISSVSLTTTSDSVTSSSSVSTSGTTSLLPSLTTTTTTSIPTTTSTTSQSTTSMSTLLVPTNVAVTSRVITWDAVNQAVSYVVKINGQTFPASSNQLIIPVQLFGLIEIQVKSVSLSQESEYSSILSVTVPIQLSIPQNIRQEGNILRWDNVEHALAYVVSIGGVEYVVNGLEMTVPTVSSVSVRVKAVGNLDGSIMSSPFSEALMLKASLPTVSGVTQVGGILQWNSVEHASTYRVRINNGDAVSVSATQLDLRYLVIGQVNVQIQAVSSNVNFLDSAYVTVNIAFGALTLPTPSNLRVLSGILLFDAVQHATGYDIYVSGVFLERITTNEFVIPQSIIDQAGAYLQVKAVSLMHLESNFSLQVIVSMIAIQTEAQLRAMVSTGHYVLENDIVLTMPWIPLDFSGTIQGNGFKISNVVIEQDGHNLGFFKHLQNASVQQLGIQGHITVSTSILQNNIGGLAGIATNSHIFNVDIEMDIVVVSLNGVAKVGGLFGKMSHTFILRSSFEGDIQTTHAITGGLIGQVDTPSSIYTIRQSKTSGSVEVSGGEQSMSGGFIGRLTDNSVVIQESVANMNVIGPSYVGGFVGYMGSGRIEDSYTVGTIHATNPTLVHVGGFVGRMEGYNNQVIRSIAQGAVSTLFTGSMIFKGAFVGNTPGGTYALLYQNCHYNNQLSLLDRIGNTSNGRGDGITGLTTSVLTTLPSTYSLSIWNFTQAGPSLVWEHE